MKEEKNGVLDVTILKKLISTFLEMGQGKNAFEVFVKFEVFQLRKLFFSQQFLLIPNTKYSCVS